jgi:hypothetical protein
MKKRRMMLKQLKDKGMKGVLRKNTEDGFPLKGEGIVTPFFPPVCN